MSQAKRHAEALALSLKRRPTRRTTTRNCSTAGFYLQYARAAEQAGKLDKAAESTEANRSRVIRNAAQAYNFLGYMWADRGERLDEAGDMIRKAARGSPIMAPYLDSLGWLYFKKGEHEKALKELLRAVEAIKPEDGVVFDHLADTYQALGKTAEALNYWQKALKLSADDKKQADKIAEKIEVREAKGHFQHGTYPESGSVPASPRPTN